MRRKSYLVTSVIFFLLFIIVTLYTSGTQGFLLDETVAYWADDMTSSRFLALMNIMSMLGSSELILIVTVLIGLILLIRRSWTNFFLFFVLSVGGVVLNLVLKMLIRRDRPGDEVSYIEVFNMELQLQSYSYPSGHTMRATILCLFLIFLTIVYLRRNASKIIISALCILLLGFIALSRVVLDAHHVTDVIGAIFVSLTWFFLCLYFFHKQRSMFSMGTIRW
ncbi:MAG TPA: phosphatase PAP2 family protein [Pseudogracilibacillus sp.]|nr:phosphatase PAP2 family protein [Pseudogracilibacillus sp.]